jgi:uncharacterized protein (TIGR03435 family)
MKLPRPFVQTLQVVLCLSITAHSSQLRPQTAGGQTPSAQPSSTPAPKAQSLEAMEAAGVKMAFDVASVKQNLSSDAAHTNVNLSALDGSPATGGFLSSVNFPLSSYIQFAYKLTPGQTDLLGSQLPKWATADRFDIEARAEGNPTRDQMRLVMQSLLADRFKVAVHFETRQLPVFALVLEKPGKAGPQLTPHTDDTCAASTPSPTPGVPSTPPAKKDGWFAPCGGVGAMPESGRMRVGSRNLTMGQIASMLPATAMGSLDRPVFDETGLSGTFDFRIEFTPQLDGPLPPNFQPDTSGPTFLEALREQLGLKLDRRTGPVEVLVIDYVEEPAPN